MSNIVFLGGPVFQGFNPLTGAFLSGGFVYTYVPGSTTPVATYSTVIDAENSTNPNSNPVVLSQSGTATIVCNVPTKIVLTDSLGNLIYTVDNFNLTSNNIYDNNGNELLGFQSANNAVNYLTIYNANTGNNPEIVATGADTTIGMNINLKNGGNLNLNTGSSGNTIIQGSCTVDQGLTVASTTTLSGQLTVNAASVLNGNINVSGNAVVNGTVSTGNLTVPSANGGLNIIPPGMYGWFSFSTPPAGWIACNGQAISRTTFIGLFAAIGTSYGVGDGSTTFNVPTSARMTLVSSGGSGTGTLGNFVGATGGTETVTLIQSNLPANTVTCAGTLSNVQFGGGTVAYTAASAAANFSNTAGSATAVNNLQPSLVALLCIKA